MSATFERIYKKLCHLFFEVLSCHRYESQYTRYLQGKLRELHPAAGERIFLKPDGMATQAQRYSHRKAVKSLPLFSEFTLCQLVFSRRSEVVIQRLENARYIIQTSFPVLEKLFLWKFR